MTKVETIDSALTKQDDLDKDKIYSLIFKYLNIFNSNLNNRLAKAFSNIEEIKPLNYSIAFPRCIQLGGFDCIVGNPHIFTRGQLKMKKIIIIQSILKQSLNKHLYSFSETAN